MGDGNQDIYYKEQIINHYDNDAYNNLKIKDYNFWPSYELRLMNNGKNLRQIEKDFNNTAKQLNLQPINLFDGYYD